MAGEDHEVYDLIRQHLLRSRGFDISGYSKSFFDRTIRKRIGRTDSKSALEYIGLLRRSDEEVNELISSLSVNVTDFFRDSEAFEALSALVLRPLVARKTELGWSSLRIWSAGCATGQETYSIAMCVLEEMRKGNARKDLVVRIVGTDLSKTALDFANAGVYSQDGVKGIPRRLLSEYFERCDDGFKASNALKRIIRFSSGNLLDRPTGKYYDLIVCRNVVIYFSRPMHDRVIDNFYQALRAGGYLMLGRTETLMGPRRQWFEGIDRENRIFRKHEKPAGLLCF